MSLLFSTNTNPGLAKKIANKTKLRLGKANVGRFADQEISVLLKENVKGKEVFALGSSFPPGDNLLELLILIHTLKVNGAKKVIAIVPYFGYSKADHINPPGATLSAKLMAETIQLAGADRIISINLHSKLSERFFKIPLLHLDAIPILAEHFATMEIKDPVVISPDSGGITRARKFAKIINVRQVIAIKKCRPRFDQVKVLKVMGNVKNKNVVIVDDLIQSGGTLIKAAQALKKEGAQDIYVAAVHLVSTGPCVELLSQSKEIKQVIVTDTMPYPKKLPVKFHMVSVDKLIAQKINK